jgi:hypothetical protein
VDESSLKQHWVRTTTWVKISQSGEVLDIAKIEVSTVHERNCSWCNALFLDDENFCGSCGKQVRAEYLFF